MVRYEIINTTYPYIPSYMVFAVFKKYNDDLNLEKFVDKIILENSNKVMKNGHLAYGVHLIIKSKQRNDLPKERRKFSKFELVTHCVKNGATTLEFFAHSNFICEEFYNMTH